MQFCPKCGAVLTFVGEEKRRIGCVCGYKPRDKKNIIMKEKLKEGGKIEIIKPESMETMPEVKAECKKCGHKKAYYWVAQTRASDEAETKFFECVKCKHRWREYS